MQVGVGGCIIVTRNGAGIMMLRRYLQIGENASQLFIVISTTLHCHRVVYEL